MSQPDTPDTRPLAELRAALLDALVEDEGGVRELTDPGDYEDRIAVFLPLLLEVRAAALVEVESMIRTACFTHNPDAEHGWITCHCEVADEARSLAAESKES